MNDKLANLAPLGLMGFGTITVLLSLHNAGLIGGSGMGVILSMGIFYGGLAQICMYASGLGMKLSGYSIPCYY